MNIFSIFSNIWSYLVGLIAIVGGIFFVKKYEDQKDQIIDLENENNNLKVEKQKTEIQKENVEVQNQKLQDEIKVKDFERQIEEPKTQSEIKQEVKEDIESKNDKNKTSNVYKIVL